jgi:UDP:flavonoid glycosyltransferase YjiC (YdhE family)
MKALVTVVPPAGHVNPITGLVAELIARGHSMTVYTGSRYCRRFA